MKKFILLTLLSLSSVTATSAEYRTFDELKECNDVFQEIAKEKNEYFNLLMKNYNEINETKLKMSSIQNLQNVAVYENNQLKKQNEELKNRIKELEDRIIY